MLVRCTRREIITVRGQSYVSRLLTPTPLSARRVCTPRLCWGGGGVGGNNLSMDVRIHGSGSGSVPKCLRSGTLEKRGESWIKRRAGIQYKRKTNLGHFCSGYINISAGHANTYLPSFLLFFTQTPLHKKINLKYTYCTAAAF